VKEVEQRTAPTSKRPEPILPQIPHPRIPSLDLASTDTLSEEANLSGLKTGDLLLPADTPAYPSSTSFTFPTPTTLIPTTTLPSSIGGSGGSSTAVATTAASRFLQNSTALQQELSDQLAQMAAQLKRNATHFSEGLAKDQAVVEETQLKLEGNYDTMQKERVRLRDHRGKSVSTTCLVVAIIITVALLFLVMVWIIRFT